MAVEDYNEIEQEERVKHWLKEYGTAIVLGVVLAIGGIFGFQQWQAYKSTQQQVASEHYTLLQEALEGDRFEDAMVEYETLVADYPRQGYTALAALLVGSALIERDRVEEGEAAFRRVLEIKAAGNLHPVARLRLARLMLDADRADEALALLPEPAPEGYGAAWAEVRGDAHVALDDPGAARTAYQSALDQMPADGGNPRMLRMKLDSLGVVDEAAAGPDEAAADVAEQSS